MVLESLGDLSAHAWLWPELHANYDCDPSSPDVLAPLCSLLSNCTRPEKILKNGKLTVVVDALQLTSIHCLLNGMRLLVTQQNATNVTTTNHNTANSSTTSTPSTPLTPPTTSAAGDGGDTSISTCNAGAAGNGGGTTAERLRLSRSRKESLQKAGELFNIKPKKGIQELQRIGILPLLSETNSEQSSQQRSVIIGNFLR